MNTRKPKIASKAVWNKAVEAGKVTSMKEQVERLTEAMNTRKKEDWLLDYPKRIKLKTKKIEQGYL